MQAFRIAIVFALSIALAAHAQSSRPQFEVAVPTEQRLHGERMAKIMHPGVDSIGNLVQSGRAADIAKALLGLLIGPPRSLIKKAGASTVLRNASLRALYVTRAFTVVG